MENYPIIKYGTPNIDAKLDDIYLDSFCITENPLEHMEYSPLGMEGAKKYMPNTSGKAYYLWDENYLYVCTVVHDETICTRGKEWRMNTVWPWNDDGAENYFYFSDEDCFAVHTDAHGFRSVVDEHIFDKTRRSAETYHDTPACDFATSIDVENQNYIVEIRIALPDYVKEGSVIGTLLEIDDRWTVENDPKEEMVGGLFTRPQFPGDPKYFVKLGK